MAFDLEREFAEATKYEITDHDIERAQLLVGVDTPTRHREHLTVATPDAIRNFAEGLGDDNPLYVDEEYGKYTRWGSQIAPAIMAQVINEPLLGDPLDPELKKQTKSLFRGIHVFVSGGEWEWYRPIRPGDRLYSFGGDEAWDVKESEFTGRSVIRRTRRVKIDHGGEVVGVHRTISILTERKTAVRKGKYSDIEPTVYTDEQLEEIDRIYAQEAPRGAEPRYWEDVEVGDSLGEMVKGPLTVTEVMVFHTGGYGFVPYRLTSSRLAHKNRKRIPAFYVKNEQGIPDVAQRVHWDSAWAKATGNPMAFDYAVMRETWLHHYLTDWMGDDGWIARQYDEMRKFNYIGDTQFLSGEVVRKREEDGQRFVDVEMKMTNQRDVETTRGEATLILPSRERGPVVLPRAPHELSQRAAQMFARHNELLLEKRRAQLGVR